MLTQHTRTHTHTHTHTHHHTHTQHRTITPSHLHMVTHAHTRQLFRERVKSGEGGMVINNEQFHELRERYSKEKLLEDGSNKATGPVLVPGRNYDRSLMNFVTEPIQATTSSAENMTSSTMSSQEGTSSASNVTAPLLAVLSITETIESTKPTTHPESVVASPDVMTSSMKNVSSSTKNVTSLQKKAAAWATMGVENEGDVFTPSLLQNMLMGEDFVCVCVFVACLPAWASRGVGGQTSIRAGRQASI